MGNIVGSQFKTVYNGQDTWQFVNRNPNQYDNQGYNILDYGQNTATKTVWQLISLQGTNTSAGALATWVQVAGGTSNVETLTSNSGGAISPTAGNINVLGDDITIAGFGTPSSSSIEFSVVGGLDGQVLIGDTSTAIPVWANLTPGSGIAITNGGNSITIAATGGTGTITGLHTDDGHTVTPTAGVINIVGGTGIITSGTVGPNTVTISATGITTLKYTNVNSSPYTVLSTDEYLSVDCSSIPITLNFPNAATLSRAWIVKDRTGNAATNNITVTTPGGSVDIDGATTFVMNTNYESINIIGNATSYEVW
jgi:hypothetical protein